MRINKLFAALLAIASVAVCAASTPRTAKADIVDTAVQSGKFPTLVAAVKAAGLVDALKGSGPFTVFAPTEEAFAKLPKGTLESLLKPENKAKLVAILKFHVISGKVTSADALKLKNGTAVKTLLGQSIKVKNTHGVHVNNAKVVTADIECTNGVIHAIDHVLLPK